MPKVDSQLGHNLMNITSDTQATITITEATLKNGQLVNVSSLGNDSFNVQIGEQSFTVNDQQAAAILGTIESSKKG